MIETYRAPGSTHRMSADSILGLNWFLGLVFLLYFLHSSDDSLFGVNETKVSFGYRIRSVQPAAHGPHAAQDGYECGPTQNRKFT